MINVIIFAILVSLATGYHRLPRLSLIRSRDSLVKGTDRSVSGMCSGGQDSLGVMSAASVSGITSLSECAQYGKDMTMTSKFVASYVSFSTSENKCMWFADCACLASSSTCLGGDAWTSIAISDVFTKVAAKITTSQQSAPAVTAVLSGASLSAHDERRSSGDVRECDMSSSDLMQHFQSQCAMSESIGFIRMVASLVVVGVLIIIGVVFGFAHWMDKIEMEKLVRTK